MSSVRDILDNSPMNGFQIMAVGISIFLSALDGFDVLAISFASPGIAQEWSVNRADLGIILSIELIGMALGSVVLGRVADNIGRRPTILGCLLVMSLGMYGASLVSTINELLAIRFITGFGIGGVMASISAMAAEYSNAKYRGRSVMLMAAGYPIGAVIAGTIASELLVAFDWRAVFVFGGILTAAAFVVVFFLMPESVEYLADKRPANALQKINQTLTKMGHQTISELPAIEQNVQPQQGFKELFSNKYAVITISLTLAYFLHVMLFYYILKWIPKLVVDMNYAASSAGKVLVWANVGGGLGSVLIGIVATNFNVRKVAITLMLLSFAAITYFGMGQDSFTEISIVAAVCGFFTTSAIVVMYALFAKYYPSTLRATGTGFIIGLGRAGSALGPVLAGFLFASQMSLLNVSVIMGCGALFASFALMYLGRYVD
jgi:benzoate transport